MIQRTALPALTVAVFDATLGSQPLVAQCAQAKLARSAYSALRRLRFAQRAGILTLQGEVFTFYHKQLAQAAMADIPGVEEINNQIRVIGTELSHQPR